MQVVYMVARATLAFFVPSLFPCHSPRLSHSVNNLSTTLLDKQRNLWCIGDIHGCYDEFLSLLSKIEDLEGPGFLSRVVLVGDLVNKGPKSAEVVRFARENRLLSVRGNHDHSALLVSKGLKSVKSHQAANKYSWVNSLSSKDVGYLSSLPWTISARVGGKDYTIVHAGIVPFVPLEDQRAEDMTTMRLVREAEGKVEGKQIGWELTDDKVSGIPWGEVYEGEMGTVVFGHDAKRGLQQHPHAVGLDTGCVYGREITAVRIGQGGREFLSVKCQREGGYAPIKQG